MLRLPLWQWVLVGLGLDIIGLAAMWPAASVVPVVWYTRPILFGVVITATAWIIHIVALPALLRLPGSTGWRSAGWDALRTIPIMAASAALASYSSFFAGLGASFVLAFFSTGFGLSWPVGSLFWMAALLGAAVGGAVTGAFVSQVRSKPWPVRARSDILGGTLAAGLACVGWVAAAQMQRGAGGSSSEVDVALHSGLLIFSGALALLPHLFLLGLDLRRAERHTQGVPGASAGSNLV